VKRGVGFFWGCSIRNTLFFQFASSNCFSVDGGVCFTSYPFEPNLPALLAHSKHRHHPRNPQSPALLASPSRNRAGSRGGDGSAAGLKF
jgi:hypothetical protein